MGKNYPVYDKKKGIKAYDLGQIVMIKGKGKNMRYAKIEMKKLNPKNPPFKGMTFIAKPKN
jgi:hypothetical protein